MYIFLAKYLPLHSMKRGLKLFFHFLFFVFMLACLLFNELIIYGLMQAKGQIKIVVQAQAFENVTESDSVKQKLNFITEVKQFAIDSIGITRNSNYSTYYKQTAANKLITVSACEPYAFKAKEWFFPFLGNVSYKGFFNEQKAKKEIQYLKTKNYDVDVYTPSGWSTLGWFSDPVLSGMLKRNEGQLSNLIIHELTHGTIYIKNNVTFNENLANFIGHKGALQFLKNKFGIESKEYKTYINERADEELYNAYILKSKERLDSLYKTFSISDTEEHKKKKKQNLIFEIVMNVLQLKLTDKTGYFNYSKQLFKEGNAFFMAFDRYDSQYTEFEHELINVFNGNLNAFLKKYIQQYKND